MKTLILTALLCTALVWAQGTNEVDPSQGDNTDEIQIEDEDVEPNVVSSDAPNTTAPANTTTPAPTTTVTPPATTSAPVTANPDEEPKERKYAYTDKETNVTCIMVNVAARMEFNYTKTDNKTAVVTYDLPANATVTGDCNGTANTQFMMLTFFEGWNLTLTFSENTVEKEYNLSQIVLAYTPTDLYFKNISTAGEVVTSTKSDVKAYQVDNEKSFRCDSEITIENFKGTGDLTSFKTWDLRLEAFRDSTNQDFSDYQPCDGDTKVSNMVPIIVGAALAGLVVIVLVAYLIGRQRNKRGYESV